MTERKNPLPSASPAGSGGLYADLAPGPIAVAASLVVLGVLTGWFGHAGLSAGTDESSDDGAVAIRAEPDDPIEPAEAPPAQFDSSRPNIFLVTVGSLRADHLGVYGGQRKTTPWISEIARRSKVFTSATATASWSLPSIVSLMTGLMPSQHGLLETVRMGRDGARAPALAPAATTLAERLKGAGYNTYALVASPVFQQETGVGRGFDRYVATGFADAPAVQFAVERLAPEIRNSQAPVFVWVHYSDPRAPYKPNPVFMRAFEAGRPGGETSPYARMTIPSLLCRPELSAPGEALDRLKAIYDSEIRSVDQHVQLLYGDLGITDQDVVVVTSDHGEEFRDHGELGHRRNLYEESVHVPLVLSWPAMWPEGSWVQERVSLVDLVPTLSDLAGVPVGDGELPATSLVPLLEGRAWTRSAPVGAELVRADGTQSRALYDGTQKLIVTGRGKELYDLVEDPSETNDLAASKPQVVRQLEGRLDESLAGVKALGAVETAVELPANVAEQLQALGYEEPRCR